MTGSEPVAHTRDSQTMNAYKPMPGFFTTSLEQRDPDIFKAIGEELHRQQCSRRRSA